MPLKHYEKNVFPQESTITILVKPPLTFPCIGTIHCEVSRLICLQATSLHAWPKHFDLLGMATLPNVDLERTRRKL